MSSEILDDFIDDCFIDKDPICDLYKDDSIWLDTYATNLIESLLKPSDESKDMPPAAENEERY